MSNCSEPPGLTIQLPPDSEPVCDLERATSVDDAAIVGADPVGCERRRRLKIGSRVIPSGHGLALATDATSSKGLTVALTMGARQDAFIGASLSSGPGVRARGLRGGYGSMHA